MAQLIFVGIAAGIASALLLLAPLSGGGLAFPLFVLTGLPIAIAGLGWGVYAAGLAAVSGVAVILAVFPTAVPAVMFTGLFGVPMVWLTRLAGLWRDDDADGVREWYPLGRILLHAAAVVAAGLIVVGAVAGFDPRAMAADVTDALVTVFAETAASSGNPAPTVESMTPFVEMYIAFLPFTTAVFMLAISVFVLWLAAKVAKTSGRFTRTGDRLWTVVAPNEILIAFGIATALALFLPGAAGTAAAVFAGAFGCALALTGLAVLHALTLGMGGRAVLLGFLYALILLSGLPLILLAILGAAENFLNLRARKFRGAPPTV